MLTIEQAIEHAEEVSNKCQNFVTAHKKDRELGFVQRTEKCANEHRQLAAWLRELIERRKAPEIIYCKDCRKHNVKVGFDENFHTVWKEDACPLVDWRGKAKEHEFDYQYCAFAERRAE